MDVVLHCSSPVTAGQRHAIGNCENLLGDATVDLDTVAVVANGDAVRMLCRGSPVADRVAALHDRGVTFLACANSMRSRDLAAEDLLPDVERASSAMGELTRRQAEGAAYLKVP